MSSAWMKSHWSFNKLKSYTSDHNIHVIFGYHSKISNVFEIPQITSNRIFLGGLRHYQRQGIPFANITPENVADTVLAVLAL